MSHPRDDVLSEFLILNSRSVEKSFELFFKSILYIYIVLCSNEYILTSNNDDSPSYRRVVVVYNHQISMTSEKKRGEMKC